MPDASRKPLAFGVLKVLPKKTAGNTTKSDTKESIQKILFILLWKFQSVWIDSLFTINKYGLTRCVLFLPEYFINLFSVLFVENFFHNRKFFTLLFDIVVNVIDIVVEFEIGT